MLAASTVRLARAAVLAGQLAGMVTVTALPIRKHVKTPKIPPLNGSERRRGCCLRDAATDRPENHHVTYAPWSACKPRDKWR